MSSSNLTYFFRGYVAIVTDLGLDEVARSISQHMLSGITFGGKERRIRDEFDAIYAETFGIRFILVEQPEEIILELHSTRNLAGGKELDLSASVVAMLEEWPDGIASLVD